MTSTSPTPYEETTRPEYPGKFIEQGIDHEPLPGGGSVLYGRCPRCHGAIEVALPESTVKAVVEAIPGQAPAPAVPAVPSAAPEPQVHTIVCTCTTCEHPGRPAPYSNGCGAYWLLTVAKEAEPEPGSAANASDTAGA